MCARARSSHCIAVLQCRTVVAWRVRDLMSYAVPRAQRLGGCQSRQLPDLAQGCKVTDPIAGRAGLAIAGRSVPCDGGTERNPATDRPPI